MGAERTRSDENEGKPDIDYVFDILRNQRRRKVISTVGDGAPVELGPLSETVAAFENDCAVEDLSDSQRKSMYVGLYQTHLPKMDDAGAVVFDQENGRISKGPHFELYDAVVRAAEEIYENPEAAARKRDSGSPLGWIRSLLS